ncbi:MAG: type II toxin-antitoxin system prevent-host-death family antitoxin [Dehalococcoidia bacterium]|nr:type II toxin-antitoxin system prevent-host-death family antitoxin [Dehalococcoidia bacterium]
MATVGVRELKNRLSHYLDLAKKGESVTVTDRGKEIAIIHPVARNQEEEYLWGLVREGRATWNGGKPRGSSERLRVEGKPVSEMIIEDRG